MSFDPLQIHIPAKERAYSVEFPQTLEALAQMLEAQIAQRKHVVITDTNIAEAFSGFSFLGRPEVLALPAGETSKSWEGLRTCLKHMFDQHLDRHSVVVGIGGGVIGDMAGFAASLFLRGIPILHVPTSLLAMVDASIGGKTGINDEAHGKNLIGNFHQPEGIFCCQGFLDHLPERQMKNGLAEMIKHGILGSKKHFEDLEAFANPHPTAEQVFGLVRDSIEIKARIVQADEKEEGPRMHLNLGHTFGHALELLTNFEMEHGKAVTIGLVMAADYAAKERICSQETAERIKKIIDDFEMDLSHDFSETQIWEAMKHDKKVKEGRIRLILPKEIGQVVIHTV